jgi:ParB-like chromosome segregation protein Spo0J
MSNIESTAPTARASATPELPPNPQDLPIHPMSTDWAPPDEYSLAGISASIKDQGIINQLTVWKDDVGKWWVIDGQCRILCAKRVNYRFSAADFKVFVGDLAAAVKYVETANGARRHLSPKQKEERALKLIEKHPHFPSRKLALIAGLSHTTIIRLKKSKDDEDLTYKKLESAWENASLPAQAQFVRAFRTDLQEFLNGGAGGL